MNTLLRVGLIKQIPIASKKRFFTSDNVRVRGLLLSLVLLTSLACGADEQAKLFEVVLPEKAAFNYPAPPQEGKKDFFTIAENGQARCVILKSADRKAKEASRAADTLKIYLDMATGANIPVIQEGTNVPPDMGVIHVGDTELGLKTDLTLPDVRYGDDVLPNINGYLIKTVSTDILVIRGKTDRATMLGVIGFLKRYAGVRHYWACGAGGIGDVVPKKPTLRIPELEWRDWPYFVSRHMSGIDRYGPPPDPSQKKIATEDFFRMNDTIPTGHSYFQWLPPDKFGKEHPEYFPLLENDKRYVPVTPTEGPNKGRVPQGWQPCVSNPDVAQIMADGLIGYFHNNPNKIAITLSVNDGDGDCMCEKCRAMDPPDTSYSTRVGLCDRYIKFNNKVCNLVDKEFPDKIITFLVYGSTSLPPTTVKLHPMLMPVLTILDDNAFEKWDSWLKPGAHRMGIYCYHTDQTYFIMPKIDVHQSAKRIRYIVASGTARLFYNGANPFWPLDAMVPYVESELIWDPRQDVDAILEEYYTKFFGPAAASMKGFYQALESGYERWIEQDGLPHWNGKDMGSLSGCRSWAQFKVLNPSEVDRAASCLKQAVSEAKADPLISERIDIVRRLFEFASFGARQYWATMRMGEAKITSEADAKKVLADAREAIASARAQAAYKFEVMEKPPANIYAPYHYAEHNNPFYDDIKEGGVHPQITLAVNEGFDTLNKVLIEKSGSDRGANWWCKQRETERDFILVGAMTTAEAKVRGIELVNLIKDPGFELRGANKSSVSNTPSDPERENNAGLNLYDGTPFNWSLTKGESHSGGFSVMFSEAKRVILSERVKAGENERFHVSVWVKHNDKKGGYSVTIHSYGKGKLLPTATVQVPFNPNKWQEIKMDFTTPTDTSAIALRVEAKNQEREAKIWIDDLFIGKYPQ